MTIDRYCSMLIRNFPNDTYIIYMFTFISINKYGETRIYIREALFLNFKIRDMIKQSIKILQLRITQRDATKDFILNSELT